MVAGNQGRHQRTRRALRKSRLSLQAADLVPCFSISMELFVRLYYTVLLKMWVYTHV